MRREAKSLLRAHDRVGNYFAAPALDVAARLVPQRQNLSLMGQSLSHYRVLSLIGAGGMGEVYQAEDNLLGRKVALKLLPREFTEDLERVRRFELEARGASSLNHPNIVTIFEVGQVDGRHFIATEYIDGLTLRERLSGGQLEVREALDVAAQIASALEAAHEEGIVHRDIKPENVIVRPDGLVKVLDFGLAKLADRQNRSARSEATTVVSMETTPGMVLGTVSYMSPEQARGLKVDARSDNFSLGVVMYEMVAGRCAFEGVTASDVMAAILQNEPLPLARFAQNVPAELERIVAKALCKDREERYQTASDLSVDLKSLKFAVQPDRKADRGAFPFRRAWALVGSLVLLLSVTTLLYFWVSRSPKPSADRAAPRSIAVLPFKPLIAAERDPVYELGLANSLIFTFSTVKELTVRPIESMRKYMNLDLDPVAVGREQEVDFVLSSHYQISGGQIRVTSQLINVNDGSTFETFKCDEKCTNIFETQDAISLKVGQQLLAKLTDEQRRLLTKRYTENREAYDLYLKGWNSWSNFAEDSLKQAAEYFELALAKDSKYALAYHGLTACHIVLGVLYLDPREEMPNAKLAAKKAQQLDDSLAETHTSLGGVSFFYDWDWGTAEREFKRAIELDPNLVRAHHWYGDYLLAMERFDEALAEMNRADELAGLFTSFRSNVARVLFYAGRYDEAIEQCNKYPDRNVGEVHRILGLSYWKKGIRDLAIEALGRANTLSRALPRTVGPLGYVYAMSGKKDKAKKLLEELQQRSKQKYVSSYYIAQIYAGLGENDQVFRYLNKAFEERANALLFIKVDPLLDTLRSDPRFTDLLRRIGLAQ